MWWCIDQFVFTIRKDKAETWNVLSLNNDVEIKKDFFLHILTISRLF